MKPLVVIVGRPNVGKSTLFNRITRSKKAIVDNYSGVTRDRNISDAKWDDNEFILVDTGGFAEDDIDQFADQVRYQIHQAIEDADIIIYMLDGKYGLSPYDKEFLDILRKYKTPVFFGVNKIDAEEQEHKLSDFYALGVEKLYSISAEHGYGVRDLLDDIVKVFPKKQAVQSDLQENEDIKISVIGKPNVGKSSLINKILKQDRLLVSDIPGTTRDSIDSYFKIKDKQYILIDTAGIRRKSKVSNKLEKFSIIKTLKSLQRCDIAIIVIDADDGISDQDVKVAGYAYERGCGCIFVINKWDLIEKNKNSVKKFYDNLKEAAKFLNFAPMITISAKTGQRVFKIFDLVDEVYKQYCSRITTGQLNKIMESAIKKNEPSYYIGKRLKFYYTTQAYTKPPKFISFVNMPTGVHFSYKRYLVNQIRENLNLDKTPIILTFRKSSGNPLNKKRISNIKHKLSSKGSKKKLNKKWSALISKKNKINRPKKVKR